MGTKKINLALIASGSGTDAFAIMSAQNRIPEVQVKLLISTKKEAGCLEKAAECGVSACTLDRKQLGAQAFNRELLRLMREQEINLIFLVGCIVKIPSILGIKIYNIHPANIEKFGGKGMFGLEPHKRILLDIEDQINRGRKTLSDKFFTEPTIHEAVSDYDSGGCLLKMQVEIPNGIVAAYIKRWESLEESSTKLQKYVLPYEWMMLPLAVKAAACMMK